MTHPLQEHIDAVNNALSCCPQTKSVGYPALEIPTSEIAAAVLRVELTREPSVEEINAAGRGMWGMSSAEACAMLKRAMAARLEVLGLE